MIVCPFLVPAPAPDGKAAAAREEEQEGEQEGEDVDDGKVVIEPEFVETLKGKSSSEDASRCEEKSNRVEEVGRSGQLPKASKEKKVRFEVDVRGDSKQAPASSSEGAEGAEMGGDGSEQVLGNQDEVPVIEIEDDEVESDAVPAAVVKNNCDAGHHEEDDKGGSGVSCNL